MFDFAETTKNMTATEILNYYRNLYYAEPQVTERGIVANAINDVLPNMVQVVRCKDCKHYHQYHQGKTNGLCEWGKCKLINMDVDMPENGFCSYGERKA